MYTWNFDKNDKCNTDKNYNNVNSWIYILFFVLIFDNIYVLQTKNISPNLVFKFWCNLPRYHFWNCASLRRFPCNPMSSSPPVNQKGNIRKNECIREQFIQQCVCIKNFKTFTFSCLAWFSSELLEDDPSSFFNMCVFRNII